MHAANSAPGITQEIRRNIHVRGVVQGVGFRPFVYTLATSLGLSGFVFNSSSGVTIEVEGVPALLDIFLSRLQAEPPPLAEITEVTTSDVALSGDTAFVIRESREEVGEFVLVSADAGTCEECWKDFGDPTNRRFGYPFTNCTQCGPRYTIIEDIPYDRPKTTMAKFVMCDACQAEYEDPSDRRFHAQPNACAICGPSVCLVPTGSSNSDCSYSSSNSLSVIRKARQLLRDGKILAIKGLGGFLLTCDAQNDSAIAELRRRKRRPAKPFALMSRDLKDVRRFCSVSAQEEASLLHLRRPIVVLPLIDSEEASTIRLPDAISPGNNTLGFMLPYTPLHYLLFSDSSASASEFKALVMTSGNLSEEPIVISNVDALERLSGVADWFLVHNRDIATRVDDSVVRIFEDKERVLRRSRGFAPQTLSLGSEAHQIVAVGAELKNTFCLTRGDRAILSQHIGDLENYETEQFFEETLAKMSRLFKVSPVAIAHDLHPRYRSTRIALASTIERKIAVQHHHAHIVSCMAEHHLSGKVIGVAMDGTGLGTDGAIWGGEFMVADLAGFKRRAHLRNVLLPGGDEAVRQPWRMALSYLRDTFGPNIPDHISCFEKVPQTQLQLIDTLLARRFQTVETSSCGRLFDAVSALLGLGFEVTFEGQAAIGLEAAADPLIEGRYEFGLVEADPLIVDFRPTIQAIVQDIGCKSSIGEISTRFHNTVAAAVVEVCSRIRNSDGLDRVCLSGGVFQNQFLLRVVAVTLRSRGFRVFLHAMVPANDGGISLGQAVVANELLRLGQ